MQQFYLTNKLPLKDTLCTNVIIFSLESCKLHDKDNISCQSQIIDLKEGICNVTGISFLCSCDWGTSGGRVGLIFTNGEIKDIYITFPHFFKYSEISEYTIAWEGDCYNSRTQSLDEEKGLLFTQSYTIQCSSTLKKIELPYLPNAHLFAITVLYG